jgi:quercetin dioxygenase-like cupin family protein
MTGHPKAEPPEQIVRHAGPPTAFHPIQQSSLKEEITMTKAYAFAGSTITVLVPGEQTNGLFAVLHVTKPSGSSTPPHSHDAETELSYVLSGSLGVETEGRTIAAGPGEFVLLPATRPHRLFNNSDVAVREFLLCAPAKFDRFVATAGTLVAPYAEPSSMTDDDRRRLVAAAPEFGIRLLPSAAPRNPAQDTVNPSADILDVFGTRAELLARLGESDNPLVLLRVSLSPGRRIPLHSHASPKCVFVISGEVEVYRDSPVAGWQGLRTDEAIHVSPHARLAIRNTTVQIANLLVVSTAKMAGSFPRAGSATAGFATKLSSPDMLGTVSKEAAADDLWVAAPEADEIIQTAGYE